MKKQFLFLFFLACVSVGAEEYHVAVSGSDTAPGSASAPFRTINFAAGKALPGDTVTVHEGVYREWVDPLYGGESSSRRILYRSFPGEKVVVKGSEVVDKWKKVKGAKDVWCTTVPSYQALTEILFGDWLANGSKIHRAELFLDNVSMYEVDSLDKVMNHKAIESYRDPEGSALLWYAENNTESSIIYACFPETNPNEHLTELSVRHTCFYPSRPGLDYITVRGFTFTQAATRWGAPTAEQIGIVGPHWSKGWIIENNVVENSKCIGVSLGKDASTGNNLGSINGRVDGTHHYIEVIFNTIRNGWSKRKIGSHIVRNNVIRFCEQAGICGSMGSAFSEIYGNHIHDIWTKRQFSGGEIAGIKFHGGIDSYIHNNHIHRTWRGIWMDWMAQGIRISSNLFYDNSEQDIYYELTQGPYMIDNNILLSRMSLLDKCAGCAFVHNIISGTISRLNDGRNTPYMLEHSTDIKGYCNTVNGGHRYYNNIFVQDSLGLGVYKKADWPIFEQDNLLWKDATIKLEVENDEVFLTFGSGVPSRGKIVDTERLGQAAITGYCYENADGSPIVFSKDYFGNERSSYNPVIGPFEITTPIARLKVAELNYGVDEYPEPVNPNATPEARALLKSLYQSVEDGKIISGIHHNRLDPDGYHKDLDRIAEASGVEPKIWGGDVAWNGDKVVELAKKNYASGHIITLMWHVNRPFDKGVVNFREQTAGAFTGEQWNELMTEGSEMHALWLAQVDSIAVNFMKPLKEAGIPVLWRPYHEMNGEWFWWGARTGGNGFVKLYRMMWDRMVNHHHLDNLLWVWNANAPREIPGDTALAYDLFYPGNEYVDVLATDIYNRDWKQSHHDQLLELGGGKLIAVGELGNLPAPQDLEAMNKYAWFMIWTGFTDDKHNSINDISSIFDRPGTVSLAPTGD